jgi:hypothetical protein
MVKICRNRRFWCYLIATWAIWRDPKKLTLDRRALIVTKYASRIGCKWTHAWPESNSFHQMKNVEPEHVCHEPRNVSQIIIKEITSNWFRKQWLRSELDERWPRKPLSVGCGDAFTLGLRQASYANSFIGWTLHSMAYTQPWSVCLLAYAG